ncbi:MAG TPA: YidB family protein [Devosia sp.]|nr:YidB family protein [Devosia sp.]
MSIWSELGGQFGNLLSEHQSQLGTLFEQALASQGGYQGVLEKLNQAGLGKEVDSWLSANGSNLPVSPQQIESALGNQQLQQLAESFGVPLDQVANLLAQHLPAAVDQASPNGALRA